MIPYGRHHLDEDDIQAVVDVLRSGALTQGPKIGEFEAALASYVGAQYAVAVSSGTAALHLAAKAAGMSTGQVAITSPITFVASANAAAYCGAKTIFADIDPRTINLSPGALEDALISHPETTVAIPVHYAGLPCDMDRIAKIVQQHGVFIIEDAAHALGGSYPDGSKIGCCRHSLMTIFSFHPVKAIATGEGGMVTTNDERVYGELLRLRSHGINKGDDPFLISEAATSNDLTNPWYYEMQELGFHYRITDIQCALGLSQLKKLDTFITRRSMLASRYDAAFSRSQVITPAQTSGRQYSGHHLYPVRIDFKSAGVTRAELMGKLRQREIITQVHYIPVPAHPYYRNQGFKLEDFPHAEKYFQQTLSLPLFYGLTEAQQDEVIGVLSELLS